MRSKLPSQIKRDLTSALLACPTLQTPQGRDDVIQELPADIQDNLQRRESARADIINLLDGCIAYENGLLSLLDALDLFECDSLPFQEVKRIMDEIVCEATPGPNTPPAAPGLQQPAEAATRIVIGQNLGKYRIDQCLGRGGMAEVYKAYQGSLNRHVAIKVMLPHIAGDPQFAANFEQEAKNAAALRHPHVVEIYDFDVQSNLAYIVMEWIEGGTLKDHLDRAKKQGQMLPQLEVIRLVSEVAQALAYAHARRMIHRDIKPLNVMLDLQGRAILTDFGLAKLLSGSEHGALSTVVGTADYMPPEQAQGDPGDPRSDIYSLGVMLYELLTGQLPFQAPTPVQVILKHISEPVPEPRLLRPDIAFSLEAVVLRCLEKQPDDRYQTLDEMLQGLEAARYELGDSTPPIPPSPEPAPPPPGTPTAPIIPPSPEPAVPTLSVDFIGRQAELSEYAAKLAGDHLAIITGLYGVGKTTLAAQLAYQEEDRSRVFWHTFYPDEGLLTLIWKLAGFLHWRGATEVWQLIQGAQSAASTLPPPDVLFDYIFQAMRGQNYLLCLDNFQHIEEDKLLDLFIERLRNATGRAELRALIISDRQLPFFDEIGCHPLDGLSLADTRQLLLKRGVALPDDLLASLHAQTAGHARLLILALDVLRREKAPQRLLKHLAESENIERFLIKEVNGGLSEDEKTVMRGLSILLGLPASSNALRAVLDGQPVRVTLNDLASRYLLYIFDGEEGRRYSQHPLMQQFYYELLSRQECLSMHRRAAEFYAHEEPDSLRAAQHYHLAGDEVQAIQHATTDVWALLNRGEAPALRDLLASVVERGISLEQLTQLNLARGQVYDFLDRAEQAQACYESAYAQANQMPESGAVRELRARICRSMGESLQERHPRQALDWLQKGAAILLPEDSAFEAAAIQIRAGRIHRFQGELAIAEQELTAGLAQLPGSISHIRAVALNNLGIIASMRGNSERALEIYRQVINITEQTNNYSLMMDTWHNIGLELEVLGRWAEALTCYQKELDLGARLNSPSQQTPAYLGLGTAYFKMGRLPEGQRALETCLQMARAHHLVIDIVCALPGLADVLIAQGQPLQATSLLTEAERLINENDVGLAEAQPEVQRLWVAVRLAQGERAAALQHAERAVSLARGIESPSMEGRVLRALAQAQHANGQAKAARKSFERSLTLLTPLDPFEAALTRQAWGEAEKSSVLLAQAEAELRRLREGH
jgi:serine/threonine protein kinase/tetratricopeptide (TPR) repeat protein